MRRLMLALALWPGLAAAEVWEPLSGLRLHEALSARVLAEESGATTNFFADGRSLREEGNGSEWGRWRVDGETACLQAAAEEDWQCFQVERQGIDLRFSGEADDIRVMRYIDLH